MDLKYLESILINHDRSGFCILEFNIPSPSQSLNPKVIMSSGNSFNDIALSILSTINWKTKMKVMRRSYRLSKWFSLPRKIVRTFQHGDGQSVLVSFRSARKHYWKNIVRKQVCLSSELSDYWLLISTRAGRWIRTGKKT